MHSGITFVDQIPCCYLTGYSTHIVGKWHLGFFKRPYTPLYRGFDSFYGFLLGSGDYYNHTKSGILDLHDNETPVKNKNGVYSTRLYAEVNSGPALIVIAPKYVTPHSLLAHR